MAKKKARRVSTVFGNQKITTSPEVAGKIKSGEITPATHTFSQQEGKVNFAPKRRAVVGGTGIMPSANTGTNNYGMPTAKTGGAGAGPSAKTGGAGAGPTSATGGAGMGPTSKEGGAGMGPTSATGGAGEGPTAKGANGQPLTPAQAMQMQEQKAIKIAPFKADIETLSANLNEMLAGLESAEDDVQLGQIKTQIEALKSAIGTVQGQ